MSDRRRINGPPSGTVQPVFFTSASTPQKLERTRKSSELRKIFLQTGLIPAASGSAYLELQLPLPRKELRPARSTLKLSCTVHGPKPLSRNSSFSPNLQLTASVKFAPFAVRLRSSYIRDPAERDLSMHLEDALRGTIIPDRWPKSSIDVVVTVLEGEEDQDLRAGLQDVQGLHVVGMMNVLAGCITVASAALSDARIDCLDLLSGGVFAVTKEKGEESRVLDPCGMEHCQVLSACAVGYLPGRDEVTEVWMRGDLADAGAVEELIDGAIKSARAAHLVLKRAVKDSAEKFVHHRQRENLERASNSLVMNDVEMKI